MGAAFSFKGLGVFLPGRSWRSGSGLWRCWLPWTRRQVSGPDLGESLLRVDSGFRGVVGCGLGVASGGVGSLGHVGTLVVLVGGTGDRGGLSRRTV